MSTPALLLWLIGLATLFGVAGGLVIALCRIAGEAIANALGSALKLRGRQDSAYAEPIGDLPNLPPALVHEADNDR